MPPSRLRYYLRYPRLCNMLTAMLLMRSQRRKHDQFQAERVG